MSRSMKLLIMGLVIGGMYAYGVLCLKLFEMIAQAIPHIVGK